MVVDKSGELAGLLEREQELERIGVALGDAVGGVGGVLLVEGPAGIGKTALGRVAGGEARSRGMRVLRAAGSQLEQEFPYGVVRQLVDPVLRAAGPADRGRLLEGAGAAAAALHLAAGGAEGAPGSEFGTLHGLYWLVANLSDDGPLFLVVDDAHWADRASLRFLAFLAPRLVELPVLLLICARPEEWEPEMLLAATASDAAVRPLIPSPLSPAGCAVLVRARFGGRVDEAFCAACHTATGGNPFLLCALLDELSDRASSRAASAEDVLAMGPRVVTRAIVARLGRLCAAARPLAAALSVLGDGASVEELGALARLPEGQVRRAADELADVSILAQGAGLRFAHPIVRNAVYGDLARAERDRLHREAAGILDASGAPPERIAAQLLAIDPAGERQVCATLRRAAEVALRAGASHSAVAYLRRALAERPPQDERAELLVELGGAERLVDGRAALAHLREALELTTDSGRYVEIATQLAWVLSFTARGEEAVETAVQALSRLGDEQRDLRRRLESAIILAGAQDPALAAARERVLAQLGEVEHEEGLGARMLQAQLLMEEHRREASAGELAARAGRLLADGLPLREDNGSYAFCVPVQILIEADSDLAMVWLERGLERAREDGDGFALGGDLMFSCLAHFRRGELADAVIDGTEALEAIERWGAELGRPWCASYLARAQIESGDLDGAERTLARVAPPDGGIRNRLGWRQFLKARASLLLARGDARGSLDLILEAARHDRPENLRLGWRSRAALCLSGLGEEPERAGALAEEEVTLARRWGAPGALGAALRSRGLVVGDQAGEECLREAVAVLDGSICRLERARALVELGAFLRRNGQRRKAREPLRDGLELARMCGAAPLASRAEEELRAAGASPRNVIRAGIDALTASERRVAEMAASGMSNKQIAQALFVTVKTVETHLHRAYQKLDVGSRAQLAVALEKTPWHLPDHRISRP